MKTPFMLLTSLFAIVLAFSSPQALAEMQKAKTVVLVHGAFADGSSWNKVIPLLRAEGLQVISVQNPLTSLDDDVAFTKRAIAQAEGPVVLVGHSWGGVVITEAGVDEKVQSLVYVSAFAPSTAQNLHDILHEAHAVQKIPTVPGFSHPQVDKEGFLELSEETVINYFASDLPVEEARLIAIGQGKLHKRTLDQRITKAAWETKPSWFIVSSNDQMIAPDVLRGQAKKIQATTVELPTSHVSMLVKPREVADVILSAAHIK
ncbi:alpha/beta fold hydrolase [Marinomonas flavescens]|uniref:alpha/beta fold hydrolase n=2 Tax=Marinomonas TaxID=28253 RepID=UPI001A9FF576|nr:alpha/beta hydrolase [Marinomonas flavescens]